MSIMVCYSNTDAGRAAVRRAFAEATKTRESLLVVNLDKAPIQEGQLGIDLNSLVDSDTAVQLLPRPETVHDAADIVLQAEQEHHVSLIVLGLRRRSRVGKLIMGSIAQRILIEADCPVLAVKAKTP